jgi:hypothetical protein
MLFVGIFAPVCILISRYFYYPINVECVVIIRLCYISRLSTSGVIGGALVHKKSKSERLALTKPGCEVTIK